MKLLRYMLAALLTIVAAPSVAQSWVPQNDYIPSGGPIAAGAAGTAPNSGGWIDVHGAKWSVDGSSRFVGINVSNGGVNGEAKSPMAAAVNTQLKATFTLPAINVNSAVEVLLRYANSGTNTTAYGIAINSPSFGTSTGALSFATYVNGAKTTGVASATKAPSLTAGTTYCLIASAYSASASSTDIEAQLYQSDCVTAVSGASISIPTDTTAALQNGVTGSLGVWQYTTSTSWPMSELVSYLATAAPASGYTTSLSAGSGVIGGDVTATYTLAGSNTSGGITITPTASGGTYTLTPPTLTFGAGVTVATTRFTPTAAATYTLSSTNNSGLTDPASSAYTSAAGSMQMGQLAASSSSNGVTLSLASQLQGGTGTGYALNVYRCTDPACAPGSGNQIATGLAKIAFPYLDSTGTPGAAYWYGVKASDSAANTVNSIPAGFGAVTGSNWFLTPATRSSTTDINAVFIGDSRTPCGRCSYSPPALSDSVFPITGKPTPVYWAGWVLKQVAGIRNVYSVNAGWGGSAMPNWQKNAATFSGGHLYARAAGIGSATGMAALVAANPNAMQLFTMMFGPNEANQNITPAQYQAYYISLGQALLTDWPNAMVVIHQDAWWSSNVYSGGAAATSLALTYRAATTNAIQQLQAQFPGHVFLGDTTSFAYFQNNYAAEMGNDQYGPSTNGSGFVHQNDIGSQSLGIMWGNAIASALLQPQARITFRPGFSR